LFHFFDPERQFVDIGADFRESTRFLSSPRPAIETGRQHCVEMENPRIGRAIYAQFS